MAENNEIRRFPKDEGHMDQDTRAKLFDQVVDQIEDSISLDLAGIDYLEFMVHLKNYAGNQIEEYTIMEDDSKEDRRMAINIKRDNL